jgi:hypothetical protein
MKTNAAVAWPRGVTGHFLLSVAVVACVWMAGCGGDPTPGPDSQAELERLRALGYVGFTDTKVAPGERSVTVYDEDRSAPGYNLISNRDLTSAQLFDAEGNVVRTWNDENGNHWSNAELLHDGDLLVTGSEHAQNSDDRSNFLLRMSWNGDVVWRKMINAHHDAEATPHGTIATLTFEYRPIPAISEEFEVKDHQITLLTDEGEILEQASLYDMLRTNPEEFSFQDVLPKTQEDHTFVDLLHANSVEFMHHDHLVGRHPIYAPMNVLVSFRHQDTLAIFDWRAKKLVWAWGQGEISAQHDGRILANGNILLFDNGVERAWSRVIELDPLSKEIVWEYRAADPERFFSLRKGSSQRLPNGNTLVANSDSGEAFEVTPDGEAVWRFLNPNTDDYGNRATIVRIHRYPEEFIHGLMRQEDAR